MHRLTIAIIIMLLINGCAKSAKELGLQLDDIDLGCMNADIKEPLRVQYIGTSGFIISKGDVSILTSPYVSNHRLFQLLNLKLDEDELEKNLSNFNLENTKAILIGHGHYDHLFDVPYIMKHHTQDAMIYASESSFHLISDQIDGAQFYKLNDQRIWGKGKPIKWIDVKEHHFRLLPIASTHVPHFVTKVLGIPIRLGHGTLDQKPKRPPKNLFDWIDGEVVTFIIEFYEPENPEKTHYRILYTDTSSEYMEGDGADGFPPKTLQNVDILIPTAAAFENLKDPFSIYQYINPEHIILGHWDNFLQKYQFRNSDPGTVLSTDLEKYITSLSAMDHTKGKFTLPGHGTEILYNNCSN